MLGGAAQGAQGRVGWRPLAGVGLALVGGDRGGRGKWGGVGGGWVGVAMGGDSSCAGRREETAAVQATQSAWASACTRRQAASSGALGGPSSLSLATCAPGHAAAPHSDQRAGCTGGAEPHAV